MDRSANGLRAAAACGVLVLLIAIGLTRFYPLQLDTLPAGFVTPILALEFTTSLADARAIVGDNRDLIEQIQRGHWLDMVFLLAYTAFLALANGVLWYRLRHWGAAAGVIAICLGGLADALENSQLLQLGNALLGEAPPPDFAQLRLFVGIKFLAISIAMLCLSRNLFRFGVLGKCFGGVSLVLVPVTVLALDGNPRLIETMGLLNAVGWLILFVWLLQMRNGLPPLPVPVPSGSR